MKALILSGGRGTRLRPLTHTGAKQLIPIANKPILFYCIEEIKKAGITDIGIVVGDTKNEIIEAVGDGLKFGVKVTYIYQEKPLGLAHAVLISRDYLKDSPFVMYLGDNLVLSGVKEFVSEFRKGKYNSQILLAKVKNPSQFGVACLKDDKVVKLVEKPEEFISDLALVGVYMFDKTIHEAVRAIKPSFRNELEITDAIQWLIDNGKKVKPFIIKGWWKDTGKLKDVLEANRIILSRYFEPDIHGEVIESNIEGIVVIEEGAKIKQSTIRGPVIIGKNCYIENSYIGPFTSVYFNTKIYDSEIEHSIILENCEIRDIVRLIDSLVGKNVKVSRTRAKPSAFRLMIGDNSKVGIP